MSITDGQTHSGTYQPCRRDEIAVKLANLAMRLATPEYRQGIWRWREDGVRYHQARIALSDACTGAVLEGWRWWRPSWSEGRYAGLVAALDIVEQAGPALPSDTTTSSQPQEER